MASDLSFITDSTQSDTVELSVQSICNGLAEGSLTYTWRSIEAQNASLIVLSELSYSQELDDPLFDLIKSIVVTVEDLRSLYRVQIFLLTDIPG